MRAPQKEAPWAVVPVKALADAKQRLAGVLAPETRHELMLVMLQDVLATLRHVEGLGPVLVVTPDAHVAELAQRRKVRVLREARGRGHSAAVAAGFAHARAHGAVQALTLPGDVPCMTCGEIDDLIDAGDRIAVPGVVIVPARDGDGTNALLVAPPGAFPPRFGPGSFARHRAEAEARRLDCRVLPLAGIGLDIDEPRDLRALLALKRNDPRYAFLHDAASAEETRP